MKPALSVSLLSLSLFLFVLYCASSNTPTLTYADIYARNVWVESKGKGMCSGTILKTGQIITAGHCLADEMTVDGKVALVVKKSTDPDLLELTAKTESFTPLVFNIKPYVTEPVYSFVNDDIYKSVYTEGKVVWLDDTHIFTSTRAAPGISGGGLYDKEGRLLGIFTQFHGDVLNDRVSVVTTFASSIPAKAVAEFLAETK